MLSKHPNPEHDGPATSPALARRRDHMLRTDAGRHLEPRLVPTRDDGQASFLPEPAFGTGEDDSDPEIPPPPLSALNADRDSDRARTILASHRRRMWPLGAVVVAIVAVGGIAWLIYGRTPATPGDADVPFVAADSGPEKIRPKQEGGIEVPNQDIRVYNELNGAPPAQESEVLLPPPEAPIAPPTATTADQQTAATPETQISTNDETIPSVPAPPLDIAPAAGAAAAPADTAPVTTAADPASPATVTQPVLTAAATGAFRIQLAAVKSADAAQAAWKKLQKTHGDVLKGLKLNVVKVERSDGALFRVQGGPFADRDAADAACGKLKQKSQACLVVAP